MMDEQNRDSDLDDSLSHNDLSDADPDLGDADSVDGDSHHISLQKIQDEDRVDRHSHPDAHRLSAASMVPPPPFSLPMPYPFSHPAYLPPSSTYQNPPVHRTSSEGSHSSESSNSSQQTWSYEEQYKQVRQASKSRSHFSFPHHRHW
ncbi:hypothetical protein M8J76_016059 [Diaphorina citri]|nr:hypothetical protein M8J76_016059 [Diaphorina citri]